MVDETHGAPTAPEPDAPSNEWIEIDGVPVNVPLAVIDAGRPAVAAWHAAQHIPGTAGAAPLPETTAGVDEHLEG